MKLYKEGYSMENEVYKEHITVDLTNCKYVIEYWERIKNAFEFPHFWEKNWDAFWDLISKECPAHKVTVIGANTLPNNWQALNGKNYPDKIKEIFDDNKRFKQRNNYAFDYEFIDA